MAEKPKYEITSVEMHPLEGGFRLDWTAQKMGFGILLFRRISGPDESAKYSMDTEMMSKEFCAAVLSKFLDDAFSE